MNEIVVLLFQSQVYAHMMHLKERRLGMHGALGDYYDGITGIIDSLAEIWLRHNETFEMPKKLDIPDVDPTSMFSALSDRIQLSISTAPREALKNKLAEAQELIDQTLYRLSLDKVYVEED